MWALFAHTYVGVAYKKIIQSFDWWYVKPFYVFEINILRKIALCLWIYLHEREYMANEISNSVVLLYKSLKTCKFFHFSYLKTYFNDDNFFLQKHSNLKF